MRLEKGDVIAYISPSSPVTVTSPLRYERARQFLENKGFVDKILENNIEYDFIFFDSGELSSLVEWVLLENQIKIGGYAILHDIYFPKSIKNFLVASFINISKNWEIVYKDLSTTQGMLVAKRVR